MSFDQLTATHSQAHALATNKLIKNTYILLSMTLLWSAAVAGLSMMFNMPHPGFILTLVGFYGLLFGITKTRNSPMGIVLTFALTGFMGYTLGPILNMYVASFANGAELITMALGGTGTIFLGLSAYALTTRKDFSFMGGFIMAGMLVMLLAMVASFFMQTPGLQLAISGGFILLMSAMILYKTSQMVHGQETNYVMATVDLYIAIYNLFLSLLHILGAMSDD
jgi:modulator of FtsH protease